MNLQNVQDVLTKIAFESCLCQKNRCSLFLVVWLFRFVAAPDEWLWQSNGAARTWRRSPWRSTRRRGRRSCRGREDRSDAARHRTGAAPRTRELLRVAGLEVEGDSCNILWQSPSGTPGVRIRFEREKKWRTTGWTPEHLCWTKIIETGEVSKITSWFWTKIIPQKWQSRAAPHPRVQTGISLGSSICLAPRSPQEVVLEEVSPVDEGWKSNHVPTVAKTHSVGETGKKIAKNSDPKFNPSPKENRKKSRKPMETLSSPTCFHWLVPRRTVPPDSDMASVLQKNSQVTPLETHAQSVSESDKQNTTEICD